MITLIEKFTCMIYIVVEEVNHVIYDRKQIPLSHSCVSKFLQVQVMDIEVALINLYFI